MNNKIAFASVVILIIVAFVILHRDNVILSAQLNNIQTNLNLVNGNSSQVDSGLTENKMRKIGFKIPSSPKSES